MPIDDLPDARDDPRYRYRPLPGHEPPPPPPEPEKPDTRGFGRLQRKVDDVLSNPVGRKWTVPEIYKRIGGRRRQQNIYRSLVRMEARDAARHEKRPWPQAHLWYHEPGIHGTSGKTPCHNKKRISRNYAGVRVANTTPRPEQGGIYVRRRR